MHNFSFRCLSYQLTLRVLVQPKLKRGVKVAFRWGSATSDQVGDGNANETKLRDGEIRPIDRDGVGIRKV